VHRTLSVLLLLATALAVPGAAAAKRGAFPWGVAAGEVRSDSAVLWSKSIAVRVPVILEVSTSRAFRGMPAARVAFPRPGAHDTTLQRRVGGLRPATRYAYRFRQGTQVSETGFFETAPAATADVPVRFALSGDADGAFLPGTTKPAYNRFEAYARMAEEGNDFNVNLGDTIYSDSEVAGIPPALGLFAKWAKYRKNLEYANLRKLRRTTGLYSHWDDHEFVNDFTVAEHGRALYAIGAQAFRDYAPVSWSAADGLYRTFRWGRHLELFFLDERSFRSAKASTACAGDLAPTAPKPVRDAFVALAPPLANPVPPGCLEAIDAPARTMLGARQYAAFTKAIAASTATWKVIVNEVPLHQFYALPYDRWEGYAAERGRLLTFLRDRVENAVVLTTDMHANLIGEIRLRTLEAGGPVGTGIWEVVTGPVATRTYAREIDSALGAAGTGSAITALFLKPAPPRGGGLECASTDVYSYSEVSVTATTLTVTPKSAAGARVREQTGLPCGPLVLRAK
jgi:alkaline phosphatase D